MNEANPWLRPRLVPVGNDSDTATGHGDISALVECEVPAPTRPESHAAPLLLVGAHGGAGLTTLSRLSGVPESQDWPGFACRVVVVARTHWFGCEQVGQIARSWISDPCEVQLAAVVWVADAAREPKALYVRREFVSAAFPVSLVVPWVERWRITPAWSLPVPRPVVRVLKALEQMNSTVKG